MATLPTAPPQESVRQDAALDEGVELVLDEPGQRRTRRVAYDLKRSLRERWS